MANSGAPSIPASATFRGARDGQLACVIDHDPRRLETEGGTAHRSRERAGKRAIERVSARARKRFFAESKRVRKTKKRSKSERKCATCGARVGRRASTTRRHARFSGAKVRRGTRRVRFERGNGRSGRIAARSRGGYVPRSRGRWIHREASRTCARRACASVPVSRRGGARRARRRGRARDDATREEGRGARTREVNRRVDSRERAGTRGREGSRERARRGRRGAGKTARARASVARGRVEDGIGTIWDGRRLRLSASSTSVTGR